jgi:membrane protease YdiL (CAAX protease family)
MNMNMNMSKLYHVVRLLTPFFKLALFAAALSIVSVILLALVVLPAGMDIRSIPLLLSTYVQLVAAFLVIWAFYRFLDKKKMADLGLSVKGHAKEFLAGSGMAVLMMITCFGVLLLCSQIEVGVNSFNGVSFLLGWALYTGVAIFEEVVCRGYLLGSLMDSMNKYAALIISSVIFSLLHVFNDHVSLIPVINLALAGVLQGSVYIYTRNLCFPVGMHLFWNFTQGTVLGFNVSGHEDYALLFLTYPENNWFNGGLFGLEGSFLITLFTSLLIFLVIKYYTRRDNVNYLQKENTGG